MRVMMRMSQSDTPLMTPDGSPNRPPFEEQRKAILEKLACRYSLRLLVMFGSHGTERERPESDVDVAFLSERALSVEDRLSLSTDLARHYRNGNLDLVDLRTASPLLAYEIACKGRVLHDKDEAFLRFRVYAAARFADTKHLREARMQYMKAQLKRLPVGLWKDT
jgi:uncharacterized protein